MTKTVAFPSDDAEVKLRWLAIVSMKDNRARESARAPRGTGNATTGPRGSAKATRHGLARNTERARDRLSRADQVTQVTTSPPESFTHLKLPARGSSPRGTDGDDLSFGLRPGLNLAVASLFRLSCPV